MKDTGLVWVKQAGRGIVLAALAAAAIGIQAAPFGSNRAWAEESSILSLQEQGNRIVGGRTKELTRFHYEEGLYLRSAHSFWDGSKGVFVNNRDPRTGDISTSYGDGKLMEWLMEWQPLGSSGPKEIQVPADAERTGKGLSAIAKDESGRYWTVKAGHINDSIATPRGDLIRRDRSLQLLVFGADAGGIGQTVDLAQPLQLTDHPDWYIADVQAGAGVEAVRLKGLAGQEQDQVVVLSPQVTDGKGVVLSRIPLDREGAFFLMKGGRVGVYGKGIVTIYDQIGQAQRAVKLAELIPLWKGEDPIRVTPMQEGNGYIVELGAQWFAMDEDWERVMSQSPRQGPVQPVECPNCSEFDEALSVNEHMYLEVRDGWGFVLNEFLPVRIQFFEVPLLTDTPSFLDSRENRIWVPLRAAAEAMGISVGYDGTNRAITLKHSDGSSMVTISQDHPQMELRTVKEYGRVYVSIRQLAELLGKPVTWDSNTYTVFVADGEKLPPRVPAASLPEEQTLLKMLAFADDFDAVTYTQAQIKTIWYEGKQKDSRSAVERFLEEKLQKKLKTLYVLTEPEGHLWVGVVTEDGFVYKMGLEHRKDYGGDFWVVMSYSELSL